MPVEYGEGARLDHAFACLDETCGGVMGYIRGELGTRDGSLNGIRKRLLE